MPYPRLWVRAHFGGRATRICDSRGPRSAVFGTPLASRVGGVLEGPTLNEAPQASPISAPGAAPHEETLPINLAAALQLSNARPLVIALAEASVARAGWRVSSARLTRVLRPNPASVVIPLEPSLQALLGAYHNYYAAVNSYNRAQFQLDHALGFPSRILASERPPGDPQPVDTRRPPQMAPVCPHVVSSPDG